MACSSCSHHQSGIRQIRYTSTCPGSCITVTSTGVRCQGSCSCGASGGCSSCSGGCSSCRCCSVSGLPS